MRADAKLVASTSTEIIDAARRSESDGYAGVWTAESRHDPFLPLALAAEHTRTVELGTSIAVAFARSPMTLAYTAWDLQQYSRGRFILGLGSQVKAHIERRFSMPWSRPSARMRELVLALRAIWSSWQTGERLTFAGDFYRHTLMTPFFSPEPSELAPPRVAVAAVGEAMCEVSGEVCDGIFLHAFTTQRYLEEVTLPAVARGAARAGRTLESFEVFGLPLVATGSSQEELESAIRAVRQQIAFYASTPAYKAVLDLHGWGDLGSQLHLLSVSHDPERWSRMGNLVPDDVLDAFAVVGEPDTIAARLDARFGHTVSRAQFYAPYPHASDIWLPIIAALNECTQDRRTRA